TAAVPFAFGYTVGDHKETWGEGISVFHNPNALHKIDRAFFGGLTQNWISNLGPSYEVAEFHPFSSTTSVFQSPNGEPFSQRAREAFCHVLDEMVVGLHKEMAAY